MVLSVLASLAVAVSSPVPLRVSAGAVPEGAKVTRTDPAAPVGFLVGLKLQNPAALGALLRDHRRRPVAGEDVRLGIQRVELRAASGFGGPCRSGGRSEPG